MENNERRKNATYRLDARVTQALNELAAKQGMSASAFMEQHLISYLKDRGFLDVDFAPIGESRGRKAGAAISPGKQAYKLLAESKKRTLTDDEIAFVIDALPEYQLNRDDFL
ncbi:MAG: hypothetical protein ACRCXH_08190 [Shewanella sp.]